MPNVSRFVWSVSNEMIQLVKMEALKEDKTASKFLQDVVEFYLQEKKEKKENESRKGWGKIRGTSRELPRKN